MALHCGSGKLCDRVLLGSIALECDHLRGGHFLRVVYIGNAPLSSMRERVDTCGVLFVRKYSSSMGCGLELLQWALRSSEFRRLDVLCLRGCIHGLWGQGA